MKRLWIIFSLCVLVHRAHGGSDENANKGPLTRPMPVVCDIGWTPIGRECFAVFHLKEPTDDQKLDTCQAEGGELYSFGGEAENQAGDGDQLPVLKMDVCTTYRSGSTLCRVTLEAETKLSRIAQSVIDLGIPCENTPFVCTKPESLPEPPAEEPPKKKQPKKKNKKDKKNKNKNKNKNKKKSGKSGK